MLRVDARLIENLEGLNIVSLDVYLLPLVEANLDSKKRMHVVDLDFVYDSQQTLECLAEEAKIQDLTEGAL